MILFVFEGEKREPDLFDAIAALFSIGAKDEKIKCCYGNNIYDLYGEMTKDIDLSDKSLSMFAEDIVSVLQHQRKKSMLKLQQRQHSQNQPQSQDTERGLSENYSRSDFSEIYLFFDLDCHHGLTGNNPTTLQENIEHLRQMLDFFDNETEHGKLFVAYPMIEALLYTKKLPDEQFCSYEVKVNDCPRFKQLATEFSHYKNDNFIRFHKKPSQRIFDAVKNNWHMLTRQHAVKANMLCTGNVAYPASMPPIGQMEIFTAQRTMMENPECASVSILSSFPLFLIEYFGLDRFRTMSLRTHNS